MERAKYSKGLFFVIKTKAKQNLKKKHQGMALMEKINILFIFLLETKCLTNELVWNSAQELIIDHKIMPINIETLPAKGWLFQC